MSEKRQENANLPLSPTLQAGIGIALALAIMGAWLTIHVWSVLMFDLAVTPWLATAGLVAVQTWLCVGLFIVAHDAMHGSLAPFRPRLNELFGRIALLLYAGFSWDKLVPKHFAHHRQPGTADDPDFDADHPTRFWPWFGRFIRMYFGWREFIVLAAFSTVYVHLLGVAFPNLLLFWALPSILAAVQLFYFGTYRPHRLDEAEPFADRHRSRSESMPGWLSLLTCFHFGYHHEHHEAPRVPWWRLPAYRRARLGG